MTSPPPAPPPLLSALVPGQVYAYLQPRGGWCVSNAGVLIGERSVILVDCTATYAGARHLREQVARVTDLPVHTVVVTHHHGDHHFGAGYFTDATVVAHEATRAAMERDGVDLPVIWPDAGWGHIDLTLPHLTVDGRLRLHLGNRDVDLFHPGPAHTVGDLAAWLPDERILFAGDLTFSDSTPFVLMGSLDGSLEALERLRALDPRVVVSGHGSPTGPEIIDRNAEYLRWVRQLAADGAAAGWKPLETAMRADLGPYRALPESERLVANLHRAYAELEGRPRGTVLPVPPILADMVEFNGGDPLPCTV